MELRTMIALAMLKEGLNCDFDRLKHMANSRWHDPPNAGAFIAGCGKLPSPDADRQRFAGHAGTDGEDQSAGRGSGSRGGAKRA